MIFNLTAIRKEKGFSQDSFSKACDITLAAVRKYESGDKKQYSHHLIEKFCEVLDCTPGDLFTLESK